MAKPVKPEPRRRRHLLWLFTPLLCILLRAEAATPANPAVEYQVKASLVFNFMHFIEWPPEAFAAGGRINICLVGRDVYGNALRVLERELVQGKSIAVRINPAWSEALAETCHVLIFSGREREPVRQALALLDGRSVLTVGEIPGFLEDGGIIKFAIIDDTVQFEVNLEAAKQARLNISSKLLRLANNVVTATSLEP